jgi:hypothetical protein
VQGWLKPKKRKRFHFHCTPTSSSWLNQVERFLALITGRMIHCGTFRSTDELETAIYKWLANWNGQPSPFVWKASAEVILDNVNNFCLMLLGRDSRIRWATAGAFNVNSDRELRVRLQSIQAERKPPSPESTR